MIGDPTQEVFKKTGREAYEQCKERYQGASDIIPHMAYGRSHMAYFGKPNSIYAFSFWCACTMAALISGAVMALKRARKTCCPSALCIHLRVLSITLQQ
jgi:hypothetical protein